MVDVEYFKIDGKKYMITHEIKDNNLIYYFLSNIDDYKDSMIRKSFTNDLETIHPLDSEEEVLHAVTLLANLKTGD